MDYIELDVKVRPRQPGSDLLVTELAELGFESFQDTDEGFLAYIPEKAFKDGTLEGVLQVSGEIEQIVWEKKRIPSQNWNEEWEKQFDPVVVDSKVRIRAPFHEADSSFPIELIIQPQTSFGTGHHQTTRLMVQKLLTLDLKGRYVLDMGCGTGILGILASKLGAAYVLGIDIEHNAVLNSIENVGRNEVKNMEMEEGDDKQIGTRQFGIIIANINKNILIASMKSFSDALVNGGDLLLSGFFTQDIEALTVVSSNYGLVSKGILNEDEWALLHLVKTKN